MWTISANYRVSDPGTTFRIDDFLLTVSTDLEPSNHVGEG